MKFLAFIRLLILSSICSHTIVRSFSCTHPVFTNWGSFLFDVNVSSFSKADLIILNERCDQLVGSCSDLKLKASSCRIRVVQTNLNSPIDSENMGGVEIIGTRDLEITFDRNMCSSGFECEFIVSIVDLSGNLVIHDKSELRITILSRVILSTSTLITDQAKLISASCDLPLNLGELAEEDWRGHVVEVFRATAPMRGWPPHSYASHSGVCLPLHISCFQ